LLRARFDQLKGMKAFRSEDKAKASQDQAMVRSVNR